MTEPANQLFERDFALIGMVHLAPLPGSPGWGGAMAPVLDAALRDAEALIQGGCDAIIVENMGDLPYLRGRVYPETTAAMAVVTRAVVELGCPVGVQILAAANREALGAAVAAGAGFIRVEAFAYAHVADEGWIDACAGELLRARASLGSEIAIWADVQKKHAAHAVTGDLSIGDLSRGAVFSGADTLIVTGSETGHRTNPQDAAEAGEAGAPVVIGSGVTVDNIAQYVGVVSGAIVGSALKHDGDWRRPVDGERVKRMRAGVEQALG